MTPRGNAHSGTHEIRCQWVTFAIALAWMACGMRSGLIHSAAETDGDGGALGGDAGAGGSRVMGSGGHVSSGGTTTVVGGTNSGMGGSSTGGVDSTVHPSGGSTTAAHGGSGGTGSGGHSTGSGGTGSGGHPTGGSGGTGRGGHSTGGSGGTGSGGHSTGGSGGTGSGGHGGGSGGSGRGGAPGDALVATDAKMPGAPTIDPNSGYATVPAGTVIMSGYVSSHAGGSGSSIGLTCTENSFCASGTVGASTTYSSWATASFSVNQSQSGASGSTGSLALVGSSISVSYVNHAGSTLELQLWDGSNYWCSYLSPSTAPTTTTVAFSSLNTQCWDNGGTAFTSGTSITSVQLLVPGSATSSTPFDYCFLGLTVQ